MGNEAFFFEIVRLFGTTSYRVTHANDIVPHWPKAVTHAGYHHIAMEVWYQTTSSYKVCLG